MTYFRIIRQWVVFVFLLLAMVACGGGGEGEGKGSDGQNTAPETGDQPGGGQDRGGDQDRGGEQDSDQENDGGSQESFSVTGSVSGLNGNLILSQKSESNEELLTINANGTFTFRANLLIGEAFEVNINSQPGGQKCLVRNGFGTASIASVNTLKVECSALTAEAAISGSITPAANITIDSDLNDSSAAYKDNDDFDRAQVLASQVRLQGFVSLEGTGESSDRFGDYGDEVDVFKVSLQRNQLIQLQVIDFDQFSIETTYSGDLDLWLFDSEGEVVGLSDDITEFEEIVVPQNGEYYIVVEAYEGISKYVLELHPSGAGGGKRLSDKLADFVPNEMIVKLSEQSISSFSFTSKANQFMSFSHRQTTRPSLAKIDRDAKVSVQSQQHVPLSGLKELNPKAYAKMMTMRDIKSVSHQSGVEYAVPNYIMKPLAVPNDEYYNLQWHYPLISLPQAWDITTGATSGKPVIVAVLDTGIFMGHTEFAGQLVPGFDFISNQGSSRDGDGIDANPDDPGDNSERGKSSFHGTHVAGTVAAKANDGSWGAGVAWGAKIMPLRILGALGGDSYDIQQALRYAAGLPNDSKTLPAQRADIINMSFGGAGADIATQATYREVRAAGVILVAAAGNENSDEAFYPASYEGVISVGAVDINSQRAPYSSFGEFVDVAAPGGDKSVDKNGDGYPDGVLSSHVDDSSGVRKMIAKFEQGTSMASPHMAGVVALMKAVNPGLTPAQVDTLLANGELTDDIGSPGWDEKFGHGLINAYKAVQAAQKLGQGGGETPPEPGVTVVASPVQVVFGQSASASLALRTQGSGSIQVDSFASDVSWLTISPAGADAAGIGAYQLQVNRAGLNNGLYQGQIKFAFTNNTNLVVPVTMQVGSSNVAVGKLAPQYVVLVDSETLLTVDTYEVVPVNGKLNFHFNDVPVGNYKVFSGSDIDNDGYICQSGESCGGYPTFAQPQEISVLGSPIDKLDFVVDLIGGISANSSTLGTHQDEEKPRLKRSVTETNKVPAR